MKALLVDDHPLILSAMQAVMKRVGGWDVDGVETVAEARERLVADAAGFDLVLLDLMLGDEDGFEFLDELRSGHPSLPVVVVSASESPNDVLRAISAGAMGYVPKRASNELLSEALHLVMSGGVYVPPMAQVDAGLGAPASLSDLSRSASLDEALEPVPASRTPARVAPLDSLSLTGSAFDSLGLTPRQRDVLQLLLQGKANKAIANELKLSVETVKDHVAAVLRCLGVNSRTQAVLAVTQIGQNAAGTASARDAGRRPPRV